MADLTLAVNSNNYGGWQTVELNRSIERIAGNFTLTLTERWQNQTDPWPINIGDSCTVAMDSEVAITGYVDDVVPQFDDKSHGITVVGRDKTGDLVDCSAIVKSGEWKGRTILQIASDLLLPFGITVTAEVDIGKPFKSFSIQEGETVFEALERAARMRGVLLLSDGLGGLIITRAGTKKVATALIQGANIKAARVVYSQRDRYSQYICKGGNVGSDWSTPEQNAGSKGEAEDINVERYRPLLIIAEDIADKGGFETRALWEAAVRMGRSTRLEITVQGWSHTDGLWQPNQLVPVRSPWLRLDRELLIVGVTNLKDDDNGTISKLELSPPEGFALQAVPEKSGGMGW